MEKTVKKGYVEFLGEVKDRISSARVKAVFAANSGMVIMYWEIGIMILKNQKQQGWGTKVIGRLSADLMREFPDMRGFSTRNLKYMRKFAQEYKSRTIVQESLAQITWYHNLALMEKISDKSERLWYADKTVKN